MSDNDDSRQRETLPSMEPPEDDFPIKADPEPKTGRHNETPVWLGTPPPDKIPGAEPVPHEVLGKVIREILKQELAPLETKIDDVKEIATTTASGVLELNTKVAQIAEDRTKDRRDIDRILERLKMAAE